jgi:hypothetical protein
MFSSRDGILLFAGARDRGKVDERDDTGHRKAPKRVGVVVSFIRYFLCRTENARTTTGRRHPLGVNARTRTGRHPLGVNARTTTGRHPLGVVAYPYSARTR